MIHGAMQSYALTLDKFIDHAAKWHPGVEVVTAGEFGAASRIGYAALRRRALRISAVLAGRGVNKGDCVATLAWNTQAHVEAWFAIMGIGAVCHTLNPRLTAASLANMLRQSEARILIASADLAAFAQQILKCAESEAIILTIDDPSGGAQSLATDARIGALEAELESAGGDDVVWGAFDESAPSGLCFTSGTTGAPKGVTYTHRSSFLHTLRLLQADVVGITAADAVMPVVPMFHANAWGLPFAAPAVGAKLVLPGRMTDGASLAKLIVAEEVTVGVGVPTVWLGLLEHVEAGATGTPSLKRILVGGSPMPPALMKRIEDRLGVTVQTSWGMTELSPVGAMAAPYESSRKAWVSGRPAVGVDLLVADAEGRALPTQRNVEGRLKVRGAAVVERYFGTSESATDASGWFDTGDLARIDTDGNLVITGRAKELIKSGGEWINPAEIEAVVGALPQVSLAAVIGRSDPKWGERPVLLVELRDLEAISDEELLEPLRGRVASWWIPDAVMRLSAMPLTSTGKIDKMRLRSEYGNI